MFLQIFLNFTQLLLTSKTPQVYHLLFLLKRLKCNEPSLLLWFPLPPSLWPAEEPEDIPQNLTEDSEKKKHKKPKKIPNIHNAITGFEKAFEQFATSGTKNSKNTTVIDPEVGHPLTPKQSDIPPDSKPDASATQVRLVHLEDLCFDL